MLRKRGRWRGGGKRARGGGGESGGKGEERMGREKKKGIYKVLNKSFPR